MNKKNFLILSIIAVIYTAFACFSSEKVLVNYNCGWDGFEYYKIASDFKNRSQIGMIDKYRAQRVLPSVIVNYSLKVIDKIGRSIGQPMLVPTPFVVTNAFIVLNGIFILISAFFMLKISKILEFSSQQEILFFVGIFCCFPFLKYPFYYPILTDVASFMFATALLYFYLANHKIGFLATTFLGAFTVASFSYYGLILYLIPHQSPILETSKNKILDKIAIGSGVLALLFLYFIELQTENYISVVLLLAYAIFVFHKYVDMIRFLSYAKQIKVRRVIEITLLLAFIIFLRNMIANGDDGLLTFYDAITLMMGTSIRFPLVFLSAHFMYFGIILFFIAFFWEKTYQFIQKMGNGYEILFVLHLFWTLGSESRIHLTIFPFFMVAVISAVGKIENKLFYYSLIVVQIILSKFWYPINGEYDDISKMTGAYEEFPWQNYFMSHGPWVSETMHYVHLGIMVLVLGYFYLIKKYEK